MYEELRLNIHNRVYKMVVTLTSCIGSTSLRICHLLFSDKYAIRINVATSKTTFSLHASIPFLQHNLLVSCV